MSNFNEINHAPLRAYNRCVYAFNLLGDSGKAPMEDYLAQFSQGERGEISKVYNMVKELGIKRVRSIVTNGLSFTDDDYVKEEVEDV